MTILSAVVPFLFPIANNGLSQQVGRSLSSNDYAVFMSETNNVITDIDEVQFLYHASYPDCETTIKQAGIIPSVDRVVYLCNKPDYAVSFIKLRNGFRVSGETQITNRHGVEETVPYVKRFSTSVVFTVNTSLLDKSLLSVHSEEAEPSGFFPSDLVSYKYSGTINPSAIVSIDAFSLSDIGDGFFF